MLRDAAPELLAFTSFPAEHWSRLRSTNPISERLNKADQVAYGCGGVFPDPEALLRLAGAVLGEPMTSGRSATATT